MKKFIFLVLVIGGAVIYLDRADIKPEQTTVEKTIENEKLTN